MSTLTKSVFQGHIFRIDSQLVFPIPAAAVFTPDGWRFPICSHNGTFRCYSLRPIPPLSAKSDCCRVEILLHTARWYGSAATRNLYSQRQFVWKCRNYVFAVPDSVIPLALT